MLKILFFSFLTLLASIQTYDGPALGPGNFLFKGDSLIQPEIISSSNGQLDLELLVDLYDFKSFISFKTRAYYYKGKPMIPGPTLKIKPGDKINLKLTNNLKGNVVDMSSMSNMKMMMFGENVTNLHTHGLHVDPNIDTIFVEIQPGQSNTYKYDIPTNHAPGLHWYHSHKHGSSALQVMGGLYGAIIVDPSDNIQIPSELTSWTRILLQFSHFSTSRTNTLNDPFTVRTYLNLVSIIGDKVTPNPTYTNSNYQDIFFTNGQFQPSYDMQTLTNVIFDMVNSSGDHVLEIQIMTGVNSGNLGCSMTLLALDGVYLTNPRSVKYVVMVPGSRASISVICNSAGTYYLQSYADFSLRGGFIDNEIRFNQNLLTLNVSGATSNLQTANGMNLALNKIVRPDYLSDLINQDIKNMWEISVDQTRANRDTAWIGMGNNCTITSFGRATDSDDYDPRSNTNCNYLTFPGQLGTTGKYRHTGIVGSNEQLNIWGRGKSPHTLHIHVNHFQFYSHVSDNGNDEYSQFFGQKGDWRDTVPALPGKLSIRYNLNKFEGEVIMHCHFLMHEDMGMMASFYAGSKFCNYPDTCYISSSVSNNSPSSSTSTSTTSTTSTTSSTSTTKNTIASSSSQFLKTQFYLISMLLLSLLL
jgi:FtsP/CotA-like multicopper oxidase with cupredoxin domain